MIISENKNRMIFSKRPMTGTYLIMTLINQSSFEKMKNTKAPEIIINNSIILILA
jgi:hypothetical protein